MCFHGCVCLCLCICLCVCECVCVRPQKELEKPTRATRHRRAGSGESMEPYYGGSETDSSDLDMQYDDMEEVRNETLLIQYVLIQYD